MTTHRPIVAELIALLDARTDLREALTQAIASAGLGSIKTLGDYFGYLDGLATQVPRDSRALTSLDLIFWFVIDQSPGAILKRDPAFQQWTHDFADAWGRFLDTPESTTGFGTFPGDPIYHLDEYQPGPSGWLSFNQFFARQLKPGMRPIDGICDDSVIVSPADSVFAEQDVISERSTITCKGATWSVLELLAGSPFQASFRGGIFTHSLLQVYDYHRFHVPVGGVLEEVRKIPAHVGLDVVKGPDGELVARAGTGFQFTQDRGLVVIDSPVGLVAVLPIGMAQISSVTLSAEQGAVLSKGEEFGYFQFGGSDIVTLYQAGRVELEAVVGTHYEQGTRIGRAL